MKKLKTILLCLASTAMLASCGATEITEAQAKETANSYNAATALEECPKYKATTKTEETKNGKTEKDEQSSEGQVSASMILTASSIDSVAAGLNNMAKSALSGMSVDLNIGVKYYKTGKSGLKLVASGGGKTTGTQAGVSYTVELSVYAESEGNDYGLPLRSYSKVWMKTTSDLSVNLGDLGAYDLNSEMTMISETNYTYSK